MNSKYVIALAASACFSLMVTACGKSSSNDNGAPQLQTNDNGTVSTFCMDNPQNQSCQQQLQNANDAGFTPYNGNQQPTYWGNNGNNNGQYNPNGGFAGAGGYCGCEWNYQPTYVNGVMACARRHTQSTNVIQFGVNFKNKNGKVKSNSYASLDYIEVTNTDVVNPTGTNCYSTVQMGCIPGQHNACAGVTDANGYPVYANCVPVQGQQYGQCVRQEIVQ